MKEVILKSDEEAAAALMTIPQQLIVAAPNPELGDVQLQMHWDSADNIHEHHIQVVFPQAGQPLEEDLINIYSCDHCHEVFPSEGIYMDHVMKVQESGDPVNGCYRCGLLFQTLELKRDHIIEVHYNDKQLKCGFCDQYFVMINDLIKHHKDKHVSKGRNLKCKFCGGYFASMEMLKKHCHQHKPHLCKVCKRMRYATIEELENHMRSHDEEAKNVCKFCQKSFSNKKNRADHEKFIHNFQENRPHNCAICWKILQNNEDLQTHYRSEHPALRTISNFHEAAPVQKPIPPRPRFKDSKRRRLTDLPQDFFCDHCSCTFPSEKSLIDHILNTEGVLESPVRCVRCNLGFEAVYLKRKHMVDRHKKDRRFKCDHCRRRFPMAETLMTHMGKAHGNLLRCRLCEDECKSYRYLRRHLFVKHYNKVCHRCDLRFATKKELKEHAKVHPQPPEASSVCSICSKTFKRVTRRNVHLKSQHGIRPPFSCAVCRKKCASISAYERHVETDHRTTVDWTSLTRARTAVVPDAGAEDPDDLYFCDHCCRRFPSETILMQHVIKVQEQGQIFPRCARCNYIFQTLDLKRDHMAENHFDDVMMKCGFCSAEFLLVEDLAAHFLANHNTLSQKLKKCKSCSFVSESSAELTAHVHELHKPWKCNHGKCRRRFATEAELFGHMKQHDETMRVTCNQCGKHFANNRSRSLHERTVHLFEEQGIRPYPCQKCGKRFKRSNHLKKHFLSCTGVPHDPFEESPKRKRISKSKRYL